MTNTNAVVLFINVYLIAIIRKVFDVTHNNPRKINALSILCR